MADWTRWVPRRERRDLEVVGRLSVYLDALGEAGLADSSQRQVEALLGLRIVWDSLVNGASAVQRPELQEGQLLPRPSEWSALDQAVHDRIVPDEAVPRAGRDALEFTTRLWLGLASPSPSAQDQARRELRVVRTFATPLDNGHEFAHAALMASRRNAADTSRPTPLPPGLDRFGDTATFARAGAVERMQDDQIRSDTAEALHLIGDLRTLMYRTSFWTDPQETASARLGMVGLADHTGDLVLPAHGADESAALMTALTDDGVTAQQLDLAARTPLPESWIPYDGGETLSHVFDLWIALHSTRDPDTAQLAAAYLDDVRALAAERTTDFHRGCAYLVHHVYRPPDDSPGQKASPGPTPPEPPQQEGVQAADAPEAAPPPRPLRRDQPPLRPGPEERPGPQQRLRRQGPPGNGAPGRGC